MVKSQRKTQKRSRQQQQQGPITLRRNPREQMFRTRLHAITGVVDLSTVPSLGALNFTLAGFSGYTTYTSLFDQYRIMEVTVEFIPMCVTSFILSGTVATVVPTAVYNHNLLTTCIDTDDANTPGSENVILQHESAIVHGPFVTKYSRSLVPGVAREVYQTGGFGGYESATRPWLDSGSPAVQHYGLKYSIAHGSNAPANCVTYINAIHATIEFRKVF
jgi:hypothetical protein